MDSYLQLQQIRLGRQIEASPTAVVSIMAPNGRRSCKCYTRLDTGADITSVPYYSVKDLLLPFQKKVDLRMSDGSYHHASTMRAYIEIWDQQNRFGLFEAPHGIVILMNTTFGHLGMDVLKHLRLEGYGNQWSISYAGGSQ